MCHVRHINPSRDHPGDIDKRLASNLNYDRIDFPVQENLFCKIEIKNNVCINVFCYENELLFPIYISNKKFEDSMDLLLLINNNKSHYVYIKYLNRLMFHKTKIKIKNGFVKVVYNALVMKRYL